MPTTRTVTVKPSGGDYATLAAAITGEAANLVSLDRLLIIDCYAMTDTSKAMTISSANYTTDATRYIQIQAHNDTTNRWKGIYNAAAYTLDPGTAGTILSVSGQVFCRFIGLQFVIYVNSSTTIYGLNLDGVTGTCTIQVSKCCFKGGTMSSTGLPIGVSANCASTISLYIWNTLFTGIRNAGNGSGRSFNVSSAGATTYLYNNTCTGAQMGFYCTGGTGPFTAVNNLFYNNVGTDATGTWAAGTDYNAADGSIGYTVTGSGNTHDRVSQTFTFVNSAGGDFHLAATDAGAKGHGATNPGSGLYSDDIDDQTRNAPWDIGFDQYANIIGKIVSEVEHLVEVINRRNKIRRAVSEAEHLVEVTVKKLLAISGQIKKKIIAIVGGS